MVLIRYWKPRNLVGHDIHVCRFLPKQLAHRLLTYLKFVKPLETFFVSNLHGTAESASCKLHLFTKRGFPATPEDLREFFCRFIAPHSPITFSAYRFESFNISLFKGDYSLL